MTATISSTQHPPVTSTSTAPRSVIALTWALRIIAAAILGQTLFFKFSGAPESVYIFKTLGVEPWGRIGSGVVELAASLLLLSPLAVWGALLAAGVMLGAIGSHLSMLGIEVQGDGGTLFALAVVTLVSSACVVWLRRDELPLPR